MSVGVATTNGNLLITFANEYMEKENVDPMTAAIEAGTTRLRPVLMTALAMILGMLPMSLALGAGGGEKPARARGDRWPDSRDIHDAAGDSDSLFVRRWHSGQQAAARRANAPESGADRSRERSEDVNSMAEQTSTRSSGGPGFYLKWIALPLVATIVAAGIVLARDLSLRNQRSDLAKEAARGRTVLCTKLHGETAARTITLPGEVHGFYETPIYAKISGYVKDMFVDKGSVVKAGQLVATIVSPETDQQVRNAKATYALRRSLTIAIRFS